MALDLVISGGNNVYWRGSMSGLNLMNGDRYIDPKFKGSRLIPSRRCPLVDAGRLRFEGPYPSGLTVRFGD